MNTEPIGALAAPLKTTVVGCGAVAQILYRKPLQRLERSGQLRVVALVDPCEARAKAMAAYFPHASTHFDIQPALDSGSSEMTLVLSPAHLHESHSIAALRRRNHVLCEKPMASSTDQCVQMTKAAKEAGRVMAIGMLRRFIPAFTELRQIIASGRIGDVLTFRYAEGRRFDWDVTTPAAFRDRSQGGTGVLFDIGPHALDLLTWLFGAPQVTSYADDGLSGVESNVVMELAFQKCSGTVQLSWDSPLSNELRVYGSQGEAVLRLDQFDRLAINTGAGWQEMAPIHSYPGDARQPAGHRVSPRLHTQAVFCQVIQVLRAIRLGEPPVVDGQSGADCVETMEAALRVARPLEMSWLSAERQASFRRLHWSHRP